ncbi:undecaprenyl-diphosphate phosphatase [Puteibacter caeruleilacunae]|nr:undecaprenyl-diphosphate phosphatase [Puteibacter caeruleilacunae]
MTWYEAILLGLIQGLTEFLPVSSSGHLELGGVLLHVNSSENLLFAIVVHGATVLSTLVVFREDIIRLIAGVFKREKEETSYVMKIALSMIPILVVGVFFKDYVESLYAGNLLMVGCMLLLTASLLTFTFFNKGGEKKISYKSAAIIGVAQAMAVVPGISRSGSTIATGLLLGNDKKEMARFSFLMVLVPILGANFLDIMSGGMTTENHMGFVPLAIGFIAAFVSGLLACKIMIKVVNKGKLIYFGIYCFIVGLIAIFAA